MFCKNSFFVLYRKLRTNNTISLTDVVVLLNKCYICKSLGGDLTYSESVSLYPA